MFSPTDVEPRAVVGAVVGSIVPKFTVFGDTVNVTSRLLSTAEPMKIHISREFMYVTVS